MVVPHSDMCLRTVPLPEGGRRPGAATEKGPEGRENQVRKQQVAKAGAAGPGRRPDPRCLRGRAYGEISGLGDMETRLCTAWRGETQRNRISQDMMG